VATATPASHQQRTRSAAPARDGSRGDVVFPQQAISFTAKHDAGKEADGGARIRISTVASVKRRVRPRIEFQSAGRAMSNRRLLDLTGLVE
jgi:hypothetical protein